MKNLNIPPEEEKKIRKAINDMLPEEEDKKVNINFPLCFVKSVDNAYPNQNILQQHYLAYYQRTLEHLQKLPLLGNIYNKVQISQRLQLQFGRLFCYCQQLVCRPLQIFSYCYRKMKV